MQTHIDNVRAHLLQRLTAIVSVFGDNSAPHPEEEREAPRLEGWQRAPGIRCHPSRRSLRSLLRVR